MRRVAFARWKRHVGALHADHAMNEWLVDPRSLTAKLISRSAEFHVHRIQQRHNRCVPDEAATIGLRRPSQVREREVLLECDEVPRVYAHTIVPLDANASDWPFFCTLGERSLGTTLFGDPEVKRAALYFARLSPAHPLMIRACRALGIESFERPLYARRCLYQRRKGLMLVTEIFLPAIMQLGNRAKRSATTIDCEKV